MISKELFVDCINSIMLQHSEDKANAELVKQAFQVSEFALYDNGKLISAIVNLLRQYFPVCFDGFCNLEHYMFQLDFGKCGEEYESPEEFYDRLVNEQNLINP